MTLQVRLTLIYAALAITAVIVLGVAVYLIVAERIQSNVDRGLEADLRAVEAGLVGVSNPISTTDVEIARLTLDRQALEGSVFQLRAADGAVLLSSDGWQAPLPLTSKEPPASGFTTIEVDGPDMRTLTRPVIRTGQLVAYVETRASMRLAEESLSAIRNVLFFGGLLVSGLTGLSAFYVAGRAVRPVTAAADLAREIEETADFTRRLPETHSTREMEHLSETFNRMIARVERMIGAQRAFLSDTSHELRRPLTVLRTDLDVLSDPKLPAEERTVVEREMRSAAESMSTLVTELLVLARSDELNMKQQPVNFSEVCRAVVATARQTAPKHRFEANIAGGIWVTGDEQALARAVGNIVQNATLYTEPGAHVDVELSRADSEVRLRVTDDGPGMSPEDLAHAFERFYRGRNGRKSRPEGLGLGLAIVRQITEAHQGRIAIHSEPGQGTTVAMGFPVRD